MYVKIKNYTNFKSNFASKIQNIKIMFFLGSDSECSCFDTNTTKSWSWWRTSNTNGQNKWISSIVHSSMPLYSGATHSNQCYCYLKLLICNACRSLPLPITVSVVLAAVSFTESNQLGKPTLMYEALHCSSFQLTMLFQLRRFEKILIIQKLRNLTAYFKPQPFWNWPDNILWNHENRYFWGVHSGVIEDAVLLGCDARSLGKSFPKFFRNVGNHLATQRNTPGDRNPLSLRQLVSRQRL